MTLPSVDQIRTANIIASKYTDVEIKKAGRRLQESLPEMQPGQSAEDNMLAGFLLGLAISELAKHTNIKNVLLVLCAVMAAIFVEVFMGFK